MHDADRIRLENANDELDEVEVLFEADMVGEFEARDEEYETEGPLDEVEEMELATELLALGADEAELDEFLGKVFGRVRRRTGRFLRSRTGRALRRRLGRGLRTAARVGLPLAAGAVGTSLAGPLGGIAGQMAAQAIGARFGLELEGLSPEEQELEVARQFVRLAADAADEAARLQDEHPEEEAARIAMIRAARRHAPGLPMANGRRPARGRRSGRWVRRGNSITLLDI